MKSIGINETYITLLEDAYTGATARVHMDSQVSEEIPILRVHIDSQVSEEIPILRVHMDSQVSEEIPILRGMRQADPISPKLFTATIQEVLKNAQLEEKRINIDGEKWSNLRFADDVALTTEDVKDIEHQLNIVT